MKELYEKILESGLPLKDTYKADKIKDYVHRIGINSLGHLCFFIKSNCDPEESKTSIQSKFISVYFNVPCSINSNETFQKEYYSVITLHSTFKSLIEYFIKIFSDFIFQHRSYADLDILESKIISLFSLFAAKKNISKKIIHGLFAELVLIESSNNSESLILAWHNNSSAIYDFSYNNLFVEVKSTEKVERIHRFSQNQINFLKNNNSIVASILVVESDYGISTIDLVNKIRERIMDHKLREKLDTIVLQTIGDEWELVDEIRYDVNYSLNSIKKYNSIIIPAISTEHIPNELSDIKFNVSFDDLSSIDLAL